jgi:diguanylate cyclase (GGDEF)-like protein/PAS domain S-box-containing protein
MDSKLSSPPKVWPGQVQDTHPVNGEPPTSFLQFIFLVVLVGEAIYLGIHFSVAPEQRFRIVGPILMSLATVIGWVLYRKGHVLHSFKFLVFSGWTIITGVAVINGGIKIPLTYAYPLVILMSGWLISSRVAIFMTILTSLTSMLLVLAEVQGWLYQPPPGSVMLFGVAQVVVNITAALLVIFMVNAYQSRLSRLSSVSQESAQRTRDLEAIRLELHQAQTVAKVGSWVYELGSDTMRLSNETCRIFGVPEGTIGNTQSYLHLTLEEDRQAVSQAWQEALESGSFDHEHRIRAGKSVRWVRQKADFLPTTDGQVIRAVGISQDITERKLADLAARQSANRFAIAFRSSPVASSIATVEDGRLIEANDNFERDFGWSQADLIGKTSLEVGLWPDPAMRTAWADVLRETGRVIEYETVWLHKNGSRRSVSISGEVIDIDGQACIMAYSTDITQRKEAQEQIQNLAFYDPLTQLPNRRLLMNRLAQAMASGTRHQRQAALLFIDLDNFKTLNDTYGHDRGDLLLQQVAQRLGGCIREGDTVARLGGDEFVVMLEDLSTNALEAALQAEAVGEAVLHALNLDYQLATSQHRSTPSIGVTLFGGVHESIEEPLKRADLAMYQAKAAGRNTLRFFDPQMQAVMAARASLELGLREALAQGQLVLHYQAQVTSEGTVLGAEALVRWQHPERGMVSPAEFIPLAEETGLILPLGNWVLRTACAQLAVWAHNPDTADLSISVNVSVRQFYQNDFVEQVLGALAQTGANAHRLKLELTESLLVTHMEDVIAKMNTLQALGVGFALDDFGTGYSSLVYLKRLPLDQLKIDQGFVRDILIDANDAAIAKMVIVLAESLGLMVIAEGVETQAQRDALYAQGCRAYQGYLFNRPVAIDEFEAYFRTAPATRKT